MSTLLLLVAIIPGDFRLEEDAIGVIFGLYVYSMFILHSPTSLALARSGNRDIKDRYGLARDAIAKNRIETAQRRYSH
jgi:hypothetical protein